MRPPSSIQASLVASCLFLAGAAVAGQEPAIALAPGLLDPAQAASLGLKPPPGLETITIHRPVASADTFAHGVVLIPLRNRLYAQWQSSRRDEDGTAYLAGNPTGHRQRYPLVLLLSDDGRLFDRGWLLRDGGAGMQALRHPGRYKRPGFSYPKSAVWKDRLYVAYATNKEDVELSSVPVASL